ncbi:hypothetical protein [Vibrio sp. TBV020]|uniref:hypothetical protein n=1 Tax=Vibrio sp. TBV020 TaxID=3137398 RepID=UPI0038CDB5FA
MFNDTNKVASTPLSNFVRNTSSKDKKKIYRRVIVAASKSQNSTIQKSKAVA